MKGGAGLCGFKLKTMKNFNIDHTEITPTVRVSSAAIFYEAEHRFQVETIVFSKDERQPFRMWIHGSVHEDSDFSETVFSRCKTFHRRVSIMLAKKLVCQDCKGSGGVEVGEGEYSVCPCSA